RSGRWVCDAFQHRCSVLAVGPGTSVTCGATTPMPGRPIAGGRGIAPVAIGCRVSVKPCSQDTILHRNLRVETSLYRLLLCQQAARAQSEPCGAQTPPHRVSGGEEG